MLDKTGLHLVQYLKFLNAFRKNQRQEGNIPSRESSLSEYLEESQELLNITYYITYYRLIKILI